MIERKNFSRRITSGVTGEIFVDCNFSQITPHTEALVNCSGLKFVRCNLKNCDVPIDSIIENCLHIHMRVIPGEVYNTEIENADGSVTVVEVQDEPTEEVIP